MAQYKTGRDTKEKIMEASKSLFYEKGYNNTTFGEICRLAEVNSGLISYHFKGGKCEIARKIYNELMLYYQGRALELFPRETSEIKMVVSLGFHQKMFYKDEKYRRFSAEYSTVGLSDLSYDEYTRNIPLVYDRLNREHDVLRTKFYFAVIEGMDTKAETFISENIAQLPFEKTLSMLSEIYLWFLDRAQINEIIDRALDLLKKTQVTNTGFSVSVKILESDE